MAPMTISFPEALKCYFDLLDLFNAMRMPLVSAAAA